MPFIAKALAMLGKVSNARFGDTFHMGSRTMRSGEGEKDLNKTANATKN